MPRFAADLLARLGRFLAAKYSSTLTEGEVGAFSVCVTTFWANGGAARDAYAVACAAAPAGSLVEVYAGNLNRGRKVIPAR